MARLGTEHVVEGMAIAAFLVKRRGGGTRIIVVFQAEGAVVRDRVRELPDLQTVGSIVIYTD